MAECGYVFKSRAEKPRRNPAGIGQGPAMLRCCAVSKIGVEAQSAAWTNASGVRAAEREEESVREQGDVDVIGGEVIGINVIVHDRVQFRVKKEIQHQNKDVYIQKGNNGVIECRDPKSAGDNRDELGDRDADVVNHGRSKGGVPVIFHRAEKLSTLH